MDINTGLTIVIPTYNRCSNLLRLLRSVVHFAKYYEISVIIVDNCSTDLTREACSNLSSKYGFIRYVRNQVNIGMELNILRAMLVASTSHVWCIGDDDCLSKEILYQFCKEDYYTHIIGSDATFILNRSTGNEHQRYPLFFDGLTSFVEHFMSADIEVLTGITWISGVVVRRSLIDAEFGILSLNQNFVHTYSFLRDLAKSDGKIVAIPHPLVIEQDQRMPRAKDSKTYLDQTFQRSLHKVVTSMANICGLETNMNYADYVKEISTRYGVPQAILYRGCEPWNY